TEFLGEIVSRVERAELDRPTQLFLEFPFRDDGWRESLAALANAIGAANAALPAESAAGPLALKIRAGGLEPSAFPAPERVAALIEACRDAGVAFKATAGLHHPLRHFSPDVGAKMHGFFNLFAG